MSSATPINIISSNPPTGAVDARAPWALGDATHTSLGWQEIELTFDGDVSKLQSSDFSILTRSNEDGDGGKDITGIEVLNSNTIRIHFDSPMSISSRLSIFHLPSQTTVCLGFFPGDINGSGQVGVLEGDSDTDAMFGNPSSLPVWSVDLNRSGAFENSDNLVFLDLLTDNPGPPNNYPIYYGRPDPKIDCPVLP